MGSDLCLVSLAVPGSVSLLLEQVHKCERDAISIEGTADRCGSLGTSHRGSEVLNNGGV